LASKLTSCELFDGEVLGECWDYNPAHACAAGCAVAATCTDLADSYCSGVENEVYACALECLSIDTFECDDGTIESITVLCDGYEDCLSGEDEVGCVASCDNGEEVSVETVCDFTDDCADGSDEVGCGTVCGAPPTPEP
jgi:hypothetical protein